MAVKLVRLSGIPLIRLKGSASLLPLAFLWEILSCGKYRHSAKQQQQQTNKKQQQKQQQQKPEKFRTVLSYAM